MSDPNDRVRAMRAYFATMREKFGNEVSEELKRTYLTGLSHGAEALTGYGAWTQAMLEDN